MYRYLLTLISLFLLVGCKTITKKQNQEIFPIESMREIEDFAKNADLVIFDIDHTILEAKTLYCHSNWFYDHYEQAVSMGKSEQETLDALVPLWEASQKNCPVKAVEDLTPTLISKLQKSGKSVMGLTTRGSVIAGETIAQLKTLGVDFSKSAPLTGHHNFLDTVHAENGIVFTTEYKNKGDVLKEYLKRAGLKPHKIVFVDDSMRNLISVRNVQGQDGIIVQTFHYPRVKRSLPDWDKVAADKAWEEHL